MKYSDFASGATENEKTKSFLMFSWFVYNWLLIKYILLWEIKWKTAFIMVFSSFYPKSHAFLIAFFAIIMHFSSFFLNHFSQYLTPFDYKIKYVSCILKVSCIEKTALQRIIKRLLAVDRTDIPIFSYKHPYRSTPVNRLVH